MAPVGRELGHTLGVVEPLQNADSLGGQINELIEQLTAHADLPVTLIGSSWGAILALFTAARQPGLARKLILIGCAVFDAASSASIEDRRLERLSPDERKRFEAISEQLKNARSDEAAEIARQWGDIFLNTDVYDPLTTDLETIEVQCERHTKVWADFVALRDTPGNLAAEFSRITQPTVVIHGDSDPHPIKGIRPFLQSCISDVRFYMLDRCGHYPWIERHARARFFEILRSEISR